MQIGNQATIVFRSRPISDLHSFTNPIALCRSRSRECYGKSKTEVIPIRTPFHIATASK